MFLSMTGFASKTVPISINKNEKILLSVEMKSINSRFFETVCKLPFFLNSLEIKASQILKEKLLRGRVYLTVVVVEDTGTLEQIRPSLKLMESYLDAISSFKKRFNFSGDLSISDILRLPNIFVPQKVQINSKVEQSILNVIDQVADQLEQSRALEGKRLQKDLEGRFSICSKRMKQIKVLFNKLIKKQKDIVKKALALQQKGDEEARLKLDELYAVLNKIDIHEEITRFNSHLLSVKKIMADELNEKGKRMDFTLQELVRESNTILAKCSNFDISSISVDIKVELEKAREQTQNVV